jgi:hypothetical protein
MNNPFGAAGPPATRPPGPGGRQPQLQQPPNPPRPPSLDGSHPGDFRLAPSYQAQQGGSWSGAPFQPHIFPPMGAYEQASAAAAAVAAAQQRNLQSFGRPPPPPNGSAPTDAARKQQYYAAGAGSRVPPPGQGSAQQRQQPPGGPSDPNIQPPYVPRLDLNYMGLGVWGEDGRRDDERPPQSAGPASAGPVGEASRSSVGPGGPTPTSTNADTPAHAPVVKAEPEDDKPPPDEDKVDHRKRKRNRTIRSCVPCHNHKRKVGTYTPLCLIKLTSQCDRKRPCGRCTALGLTGSCVYEVDEARDP